MVNVLSLVRKPFTRTRLDEERAQDKSVVVAIRFNREELAALEEAGRLLQQEKPSTIIKQLVDLGMVGLQREETSVALRLASENMRRNWRLGIAMADPHFSQK